MIRRARGNEDRHFGVTDALMLVADIVLIVLWAWGGANVLLGAMLLVLLVLSAIFLGWIPLPGDGTRKDTEE